MFCIYLNSLRVTPILKASISALQVKNKGQQINDQALVRRYSLTTHDFLLLCLCVSFKIILYTNVAIFLSGTM